MRRRCAGTRDWRPSLRDRAARPRRWSRRRRRCTVCVVRAARTPDRPVVHIARVAHERAQAVLEGPGRVERHDVRVAVDKHGVVERCEACRGPPRPARACRGPRECRGSRRGPAARTQGPRNREKLQELVGKAPPAEREQFSHDHVGTQIVQCVDEEATARRQVVGRDQRPSSSRRLRKSVPTMRTGGNCTVCTPAVLTSGDRRRPKPASPRGRRARRHA